MKNGVQIYIENSLERNLKCLRNNFCSGSLTIKEMQTKTTSRFHLTPVFWHPWLFRVNDTCDSSCCWGCGAKGTLMAGVHTCTATMGLNMTAPQEAGNLLTSRPSSSFRSVSYCSENLAVIGLYISIWFFEFIFQFLWRTTVEVWRPLHCNQRLLWEI